MTQAHAPGRTLQVHAADGTALHVTDYLLAPDELRGSIVLMHGLGEHSGRYRHVAQFFNDCGLSVRCYDHRGHGHSKGKRGDVIYGDPMIQDAQIVVESFAAHFNHPPLLFGHSMGGLFAARIALAGLTPLRGLILSSPALAINMSTMELRLLKLLHRLAPYLPVPNGLATKYLSHDPNVVAAYKADPLVHSKITARLLRSMLSAMDYCQAHAPELTVPTLMVVAGDDHLVDAEGSKRFFARLQAGLAQLHIYDNFYHEIFNEVSAQQPFDDVRAWLIAQNISPA